MQEQILIRVWKACNYKCIFCNITDINEKNIWYKETYISLINQFHNKIKLANLSKISITITWGEPTLFKKEVMFIIKYINKYCINNWIDIWSVDMQSNATLLDYDFLLYLKKNKVDNFLVSFHAINRNIFEELLGVKYDLFFDKVVNNIKLLQSMNFNFSLNIIVNKLNHLDLMDIIHFIWIEFPWVDVELWLVQPNWDWEKNIDKLFIDFSEVYKNYNKALYLLNFKWHHPISHYCWMPLCYIDKHSFSTEFKNNIWYIKEGIKKKFFINTMNDNSKLQIKDCNICLYNNICSWIWKNYEWKQTLKPIKYSIDFFSNFKYNNYSYKLDQLSEDLRKIYSKNIRHVIIKTSLINDKYVLLNLVSDLFKKWFYKISLLVDCAFKLDDEIIYSWISNIQINIEYVDEVILQNIINFSNKYKPQFRIDIDIFVKKYNDENNIKLKNILKCKSNFYKIFFIYDYYLCNKDIYEYNNFINNSFFNIYTINFNKKFLYGK